MNEMPKIPKVGNMPIVSLADQMRGLADTGKRVNVLWQEDDTLAFVARGREYRSEFHINPCDEVMYPIKGDMRLHYRTPEGKEEVALVPEGSVIHTPAGTPHSPRFGPESFALISSANAATARSIASSGSARNAMRCCTKSRPWCDDYRADPVSKAYADLFDNEVHRTCKKCGNVMPKP